MSLSKNKDSKKTEKERVAERREEVLAKGRKFKYPLQWTRHRIVISTIFIAIMALILLIAGGWAALYKFGMTDALLFNVTKVVPLAVANVDGEPVRFADYLMLYRSSILPAQKQRGGQAGEDVVALENRYKRKMLTEAEKYALAEKLARELDISVSEEEIAEKFQQHLQIGGVEQSEEGFIKIIINENLGLTRSEYERILYLTLLKMKVEMAIDDKANEVAEKIEQLLAENGNDYQKVKEALGDAVEYESTGGLVDNKNIDGGRTTAAMQLEPGQSSGRFVSLNGDGFYFVKLANKTDDKVSFESLRVPFREFDQRLLELKDAGKVAEYIEISETEEM